MTLQELRIVSYLMMIFSNEEKSYLKIALRDLNLTRKVDCEIMFKFLNEWGCRQFKIENHIAASKDLKKWYKNSIHVLPKSSLCLIDLSDRKIKHYSSIFETLKESYASTDKRGFNKTVGPVGAAKILFALRKNMFPPWDNPIIRKLNFSNNGEGYTNYLLRVKNELLTLEVDCKKQNIEIKQLPRILNRPHVSLVKLIDEYFWLTITKKCEPNEIIKLIRNSQHLLHNI